MSPSLMAQPLLPAEQPNVPSLYLRAERHTGSNFLEEILRINFKRSGSDDADDALKSQFASEHPGCTDNRISIGSDCYLPSPLFSGCDARGHEGDGNFCCWKHGYACAPAQYWPASTVLVVLVRSPYSFLPALHKMPYETLDWNDMTFSDFLRRPWGASPEHYARKETAENPIALWVDKMRSYRQHQKTTVVLRTSDLFHLNALEEKLSKLDSFGFARLQSSPVRYPDFDDSAGEEGKFTGKFSKEGFEKARDATQLESFIKEYTQADLDWVNAEIQRLSADALLDWAQIARVWTVSASGGASTVAAKMSNLVALNASAVRSLPDAVQLFDASGLTRR